MKTIAFEPGNLYLVKGRSDLFWWVLRDKDLPDIKILWRPDVDTLRYHVDYSSPFEEPSTYIIIQPPDIPTTLAPAESNYYFVLLTNPGGEFPNKSVEKSYKALAGGCYQQVDLSRYNWRAEQVIWDTLDGLESIQKTRLLEDFNNPFRLLRHLQSPIEYDTIDIDRRLATNMLESLGKPESLKLWSGISRRDAYALYGSEELERCGFYLILNGSPKTKSFGMCPELWFYMEQFINVLRPYYEQDIRAIGKLFAQWLLLCNTTCARWGHQGFVKIGRNKQFWIFKPSQEALAYKTYLLSRFSRN